MPAPANPELIAEIDPAQWHHRPDDQNRLVEARSWSNHVAFGLDEPSPDSLLVLPGLGEREKTIESVLKYCAELGIPAVSSLFAIEQVRATKTDVAAFVTDFGVQVTAHHRQQGSVPDEARVVGHSMNGGILGLALGEAPELFGDVGFEEPAGHNNRLLMDRHPNRIARDLAFVGRFGRVILYPAYKAGLGEKLVAGQELGYQLAYDTAVTFPPVRRLWNKFDFAANIDPIPNVLAHALSGRQVAYVLGNKDPLVRPDEVQASIEAGLEAYGPEDQAAVRKNLTVVRTDNRHSHMAFPAGREHLRIVTDIIYPEEKRVEREAA